MSNKLFSELCTTFETLASTTTKQGKLRILQQFVNSCDRNLFHDVVRLFLPHWERQRKSYRLREHTFTKILQNILCLPATGADMQTLKNFNKLSTGAASKYKDYADAAYAVVRKTSTQAKSLTIKEINVKLDGIASGNIREQETIIFDLFQSLSHIEIKWLIRILLKELKLGNLGKSDILSTYHPDAPKYFLINNSLKELCDDLIDKSKSANEIQLSLFNAFRPMLSLRCDVKEFNKAVKDDIEFYIEEKFDGERFQIHFDAGRFKYFSRNGFDFSKEFLHHSDKIKPSLKATSVILDGEMMIYNKKEQKFGSKGMHADIKKVKPDSNIQQCFCAFDILYLNGKNLCNKPLKERKQLLRDVVKPITGIILISSWIKTEIGQSRHAILDALNTSMDEKQEGIVFKCPMSTYLPNERIGWWKLKLEFFEGVMSDLDVLIIGGYYGQGATKGEIVGFLVAAKEGNKFLSFAKVTTGLKRAELKILQQELYPNWKDLNGDNHEMANVFWGKEKPDKWIPPQFSKCLLVRGSELVKVYGANADYRTAYTLRFQRILGLRLDKRYDDCLTTDELAALTEGSCIVEKLNKRHLELSDLEIQPKAKRQRKGLPKTPLPVDVQTDILSPYIFVVLSGIGNWHKELVEIAIRENGGIAALDCTKDTYCMLVGDEHIRTTTYKGDVDIVHTEWLRRVLNEGELFDYEPVDVVYMSPKSKFKFAQEYDKFGDSYTKPATRTTLDKILNEQFIKSNMFAMQPTVAEINEFNKEINFRDEKKLLRGYVGYFDQWKVINDPLSKELHCLDFMERVNFKLAGGKISEYLNNDCDCVIAAQSRIQEVESYIKSLNRSIAICTSSQEFIQRILHET